MGDESSPDRSTDAPRLEYGRAPDLSKPLAVLLDFGWIVIGMFAVPLIVAVVLLTAAGLIGLILRAFMG